MSDSGFTGDNPPALGSSPTSVLIPSTEGLFVVNLLDIPVALGQGDDAECLAELEALYQHLAMILAGRRVDVEILWLLIETNVRNRIAWVV